MSLFRKIANLFLNKKFQPFIIVEPKETPLHIREIAKLYPILHTVAGNRAVGEIRLFEFEPGRENKLRTGQAFIIHEKGLAHTWIHLGNDYFKLVMKA